MLPPAAALARDKFIDGLVARGFTISSCDEDTSGDLKLVGNLVVLDDAGEVEVPFVVTVPEQFPYVRPRVRPEDGTGGATWHQERSGALCLWGASSGLEVWSHADAVLERVKGWYRAAANGWVDYPPDLDLDRYWEPGGGMVLYSELNELHEGFARVQSDRLPDSVVRVLRNPTRVKQNGKRRVFVVDIGETHRPPRSIHDIASDCANGEELLAALDNPQLKWVLVKYRRGCHQALLSLRVLGAKDDPRFVAVETASEAQAARLLRSGPDLQAAASKKVCIIGVGSVGSAVAELLVRSGVRDLVIVDPERLRPGNVVRHQALLGDVGKMKVDAVQTRLQAVDPSDELEVTAAAEGVYCYDDALCFFKDRDLIIDATGNDAVTAALVDASRTTGQPLVVAALSQQGQVGRADRSPLGATEKWDDDPELELIEEAELREGGCGDPVQPSSPWKPQRVATAAVKMSLDLLSGRMPPPSNVEIL